MTVVDHISLRNPIMHLNLQLPKPVGEEEPDEKSPSVVDQYPGARVADFSFRYESPGHFAVFPSLTFQSHTV